MPAVAERAAVALLREVMMVVREGLVRAKEMAACTLGSMLPGANWRSVMWRSSSLVVILPRGVSSGVL